MATAALVLPLALGAQTNPTPGPLLQSAQIEGVTITTADIHQFLGAMHQALQPNDMTVPVIVLGKRSAEMPAYDPYTHYVGIQQQSGKKVMIIWANADHQVNEMPMIGAFTLAISDGGYGGPAFKRLYDIYAAKDAQLPAGAPDPYLNRHGFADAMARSVMAAIPSPGPTASP